MTNKPLTIAFIGGGINSAVGNTHRIACQMDNSWTLVSGCFSSHKEINLKTSREWGIENSRLYDNWRQLLNEEQGKVDAICILTPTPMHAEMAIEALNMGYAIICEKAMATSSQEADNICQSISANRSFFAVTFNYTGYPMLREIRQMISDDKLGKICQIQIEMPQEGFARLNKNGSQPKPQNWRLKDSSIPTISLDLGVHLHHMIYFLTGQKPIDVVSDHSCYGFFNDIVDNVSCIARYSNNLRAQIWYSKMAIGNRNGLRVRLYGNKGSAEWFQMVPEEILYCDQYGRREIIDRASCVEVADQPRYNRFKSGHPAGFIEAFANQYYDIAESLRKYNSSGNHESPFVFSAKEAKEGLEMMEAISSAANKGCWQKV